MRLWSIHPMYLDSRGLVALWREALLAQKVLLGQTKGYQHHPQLNRFKRAKNPIDCIGYYLLEVYNESLKRSFKFDSSKIVSSKSGEKITVTTGQLEYELKHLKKKLRSRDPEWLKQIQDISAPKPHPIFKVIPGSIADWEIIK